MLFLDDGRMFARLILPLDDGGAVPIAIVRLAHRYAGPDGSHADANSRVFRIRSRYSTAFSTSSRNFDLNGEGQDGKSETERPDHSTSLGDSITSSTQIGFSAHTGIELARRYSNVTSPVGSGFDPVIS